MGADGVAFHQNRGGRPLGSTKSAYDMLKVPARKGVVGRPLARDPPCIVQCAECLESVLAARHRYWDAQEELHRHQPASYAASESPDFTMKKNRFQEQADDAG